MVRLVLASSKGNGVRYFPYVGYLGLTPVKVEGVVVTRLDHDLKPLPTKSISISVRCYELLLGRTGVLQSNVLAEYNKVLWEKPEDQDHADVGDMELPFRLSVPARVGGHSTASFVEYRCIWRVEAVLNHIYITGVGSRLIKHSDLPLVRYDIPQSDLLPRVLPPSGIPPLQQQTTKPRAPRIRYTVISPSTPIGPMDLISIALYLLPSDTSVVVRSASAIIERRIHTKDTPSALSPPSQTASHTHTPYQEPYHNTLASSSSLLSSNPTITPDTFVSSSTSVATDHRPLLPSNAYRPSTSTSSVEQAGARSSIHPVVGTESAGPFRRDQNGIFSKTLTVPWPVPKSSSRWAIGETIQTEFISVKFFVRVKIIVTSATGTESLDLEDQELFIVSTNDAERQLALSNYNDSQRDATRSKSKSPRRSRKATDDVPLPPTPTQASTSQRPVSRPADPSSSSASTSVVRPSTSKPKTPRRPHTSAGPRDMATKFEVSADQRRKFSRPGTMETGSGGAGPIRTRDSMYAPRMTSGPSGGSTSSASSNSMTSGTSASSASRGSADIREWEQELARIELQSRRSSDLLGFGMKRHRSSTATRILIASGDS
ncbi:hypothetical protein CPB85DRAFT_1428441 [Mucidula mucida]|nr:hypothetical protein CPB85DRAFT_1428441 [Mucidula mucida]